MNISINKSDIAILTAGQMFAAPQHTPSSGTDAGKAGQICWDANFIYVWTADNTVGRVAIVPF